MRVAGAADVAPRGQRELEAAVVAVAASSSPSCRRSRTGRGAPRWPGRSGRRGGAGRRRAARWWWGAGGAGAAMAWTSASVVGGASVVVGRRWWWAPPWWWAPRWSGDRSPSSVVELLVGCVAPRRPRRAGRWSRRWRAGCRARAPAGRPGSPTGRGPRGPAAPVPARDLGGLLGLEGERRHRLEVGGGADLTGSPAVPRPAPRVGQMARRVRVAAPLRTFGRRYADP